MQEKADEQDEIPVGGLGGPSYRQHQDEGIKMQFPGIDPVRLRKRIFWRTRHLSVTEEIEQEVYINLDRFLQQNQTEIGSILALSFRIADRLVYRWFQRCQSTPDMVPLQDLTEEDRPRVSIDARLEAENFLERLLSELPDILCEPFLLHNRDEYSIEEIAEELNIGVGAVRYRLILALQKVEKFMRRHRRELLGLRIPKAPHHGGRRS